MDGFHVENLLGRAVLHWWGEAVWGRVARLVRCGRDGAVGTGLLGAAACFAMRNVFFDWQMYRSAMRACQGLPCPRSARPSGRRHRLDESATEVRDVRRGCPG
ncbi:hypothetical protein GCM10009579_03870 [Streptomyces javensis]|uniref:Uncharacterized protein n=1 Tax=Streptomyces javensis TaxID=114698 RepID=A0ABN1WJY1_9ACTN